MAPAPAALGGALLYVLAGGGYGPQYLFPDKLPEVLGELAVPRISPYLKRSA